MTTVNFAMDYLPSPSHVGLAWAMQHGLFKKAGIKLNILPFGATASDTLISTGRADLGFTGSIASAITVAAAGGGETPLFLGSPGQPYKLGVLASSGITRPAQLAGKIYGGFGSPLEAALADTMVASDGGKGKMKIVTLSVGAYEALTAKKVDAVFAYADQIYQNQQQGVTMNLFDPKDFGAPADTGLLAVANTAYAKKHDKLVRAFVSALQEGYEKGISDPDGGAEALEKAFPGKVDDGLAKFVGQLQAKTLLPNPDGPVGTENPAQWQAMADWLIEHGQLADSSGKQLTSFDATGLAATANSYLPK